MQINTKQDHTAVVVVDIQADFTQAMQGSLAVGDADREYLNAAETQTRRLKALGYPIYATQDWHPANHISFFSNHDNAKPYDVIEIEGRQQVLWPPHCVQDTANARILMDESLFTAIVKKGMDPAFDSYSGFFDDGKKETGLADILKNAGIKKLIIYGLATDYCVKATVMDAIMLGFDVTLIKDLCRGVTPESTAAALEEMKAAGVDIC
ncbi:bifunctional nicotinamidase/pyrazinamidase [Desulfobacter hydrogenophilus]|uniref:nicotinamidase n=1 Tax=Desulfobacter hydrogenophilus TaxID=2291 RepID=A0A328FIH1_9BACT|nr:bifunctional nicotinamidase/pyrazinamidase [Desulfobacter hydrogenophilus]NDY73221.1 bifunctional nicotinamidase/pyrazinamidase [Desulfobacter hydrogenophilus]QBH12537.1 bifunctional nicotinamidase/pyrazinamidase [Desulfobacter hydrogenophilus]RAM03272.1 bifunctional nicotinamidase/pyrazinamidase [Desulfobacter hydrogenophilus]